MQRHPVVRIGDLDNEQLVQQLASDNSWNRETAQRLIWERQDQSMVKALSNLLASTDKPLGRLHSLYALQGLNALTLQHVRLGLSDAHPRVQAHTIRMAEAFLEIDPQLIDELLKLSDDQNEHVRFQLAFTLGESLDPKAIQALARLSRSPGNSTEVRTALMSSVGSNADQLAASLLQDREFCDQQHAVNVLSELALVIGANPEPSVSLRLLEAVASDNLPLTLQQRLLTALGEGLARRGFSIAQLLNDDACPEALGQSMPRLFMKATQIAGDEKQSIELRATGIRILAFATWKTAEESLLPLLSPQTPQQLQRATIASVAEQSSNDVAKTLLKGWRGYSPQIRREVVEGLLSQSGRLAVLLDAVDAGSVRAMDIEVDKRQMLMKHPDKQLRSRCEQIFEDSQNTNRTQVVNAWQDALSLDGDADLGFDVFKKRCSICHQVGDLGHKVAPDLASVKNKSATDLLIAILDPNREAQPNFNTYTAETKEGRIFSGIIAAEDANSITLRRAEAKQDVVLRSNIEEMTSNGISLMPEGLEKEISRQDLANVIAFVKTIGK